MATKRLLIGLALFVGTFLFMRVWILSIAGPLPPHPDLRAMWEGFSPARRGVVIVCFIANAYGLGLIANSLIGLARKK